jgi:flavodoxin
MVRTPPHSRLKLVTTLETANNTTFIMKPFGVIESGMFATKTTCATYRNVTFQSLVKRLTYGQTPVFGEALQTFISHPGDLRSTAT